MARATPTLGIGITTYNRVDMLARVLDAVKQYTSVPYILFVADDGSSDDTGPFLQRANVPHLSAGNRGIAWNKNRALFWLNEVQGCDVVILLEDDTFPDQFGWELNWITAAERFGHMNLAPAHWPTELYMRGSGTVEDPYVSGVMTGQCVVFSREALQLIGYMDTRFRRYGYEHAEHTNRLIRCGFGGEKRGPGDVIPFLMAGALRVEGLDKPPDMDGMARNGPIYEQVRREEAYRHAWRGDEEMAFFRNEMASVHVPDGAALGTWSWAPDWYVLCCNDRSLVWSNRDEALFASDPREDRFTIVLEVRGRNARLRVEAARHVQGGWLNVDNGHARLVNESEASLVELVYSEKRGFGLRHAGLLLCCDKGSDQRASFNRLDMNDWETFYFAGYVTG